MARLVFECGDRDGDLVFFQTSEKEGKELAASYESAKKWLLDNGFTPLKAGSNGKPKSREKVRFDGHRCPKCNGAVWDNRAKKGEDPGRAKWPDFSCRDKEGCQWAVWPGQYELAEEAA